jgi:hypothetical protein
MILDEFHFSPFGLVMKLDFIKKKKKKTVEQWLVHINCLTL